MSNRIIKESIHDSEKINSLSDFQFRLWVHLITYVDDYGRGDARPAIIKGNCFPLRMNLTLRELEAGLHALADAGCIGLYTVDGRAYLYFPGWDRHQRVQTKRSKCPGPEEADRPIPRKDTAENTGSRKSTVTHGDSRWTTVDHGDSPPESESEYESKSESEDVNTHTNQTATGRRARARAWFDPEHPDAGDDEAWRTGDRARSAIAQRIAAWAISTLQLRQRHVVTEAGTVGENIHGTLCEAMRCGISPAQCVELARQTEVLWEWELLLKADTIGQGGGSPEWRDQVEELREEIFRIRGAA